MNAAVGETTVQSTPAIALAARMPTACIAASSPNAEPRRCPGASWATAAVSAVSAQPIPTPARTKQPARSGEALAAERRIRCSDAGSRRLPSGEDAQHPAAVTAVPGGDAGQRRGEVVGGVEHERELDRRVVRAAGLEQVGGAEDQQRRGEVAELERSRRGEQPAEPPVQQRADAQADRLALAGGERRRVADRVDDRERRRGGRG